MNRGNLVIIGLGLMLAVPAANDLPAAEAPARPRLPREDLLLWRDANGVVRPVRTLADWQQRRAEIVRGMERVMGPLPGSEKRCPLDVQVDEEFDGGAYLRRLISYAAEPGSRTPAYLLIPKAALDGTRKFPAVLCLHPTDNTTGHGVVVGLGGKANRNYAQELAERGYVTIAPNYPRLAKYQPDLKGLGYASGTMKAIWDNLRALDLLDSLPFVRGGRYGAIGHSLGGHNSVYTAVFDERIIAVASSCGLDSYLDYYSGDPNVWRPGRGWTQDRYMPRLADYAGRLAEIPYDFHELIGALAPRRVFIAAPLRDSNFKWDSVDRIAAAAAPVFELHGKRGNLRVEHPDCDHDFPDAMREIAYRMFDEVLK
jgi:dienelactone hydrolase